MRNITITPAHKEERTLKIKDFSFYTDFAVNTYAEEKLYSAKMGEELLCASENGFSKIYSCQNKILLYGKDGKIYQFKNGKFVEFSMQKFHSAPEIFSVTLSGVPSVAIAENGHGVIVGDSHAYVTLPKGNGYLYYNGVLFCADGDKIRFGGDFDYSGYTVNLKTAGFIGVYGKGKILKLIPAQDKIIVFCQHGIAYLYPEGDRFEYRLETTTFEFSGVDEKSIVSFNGCTYFLRNGKLCVFSSTGINELSLPSRPLNCISNAVNYYGLCMFNYGDGVFVFDTVKKNSFYLPAKALSIATGGYFLTENGEIKVFSLVKNAYDGSWESLPLDLGTYEEKTVYRIVFSCSAPVTLRIKSERGEREIRSDGGLKSARISLLGKTFSLTVNGDSAEVSGIKIYYRI